MVLSLEDCSHRLGGDGSLIGGLFPQAGGDGSLIGGLFPQEIYYEYIARKKFQTR